MSDVWWFAWTRKTSTRKNYHERWRVSFPVVRTRSRNEWAYAYDADGERMLVYNASNGSSTFRIRGLDNKPLREVRYSGGVWSWGKDWIYRDGSLLATVAPGASGVRYVHADHLGSPRLFTDAAGLAQERYHYYPFGEQAGSAPATPEAMRFTGHERDPAASTGTTDDLDYMHARYCNPQLGRFLSTDPRNRYGPVKPSQRWNRYAYAIGNPLKFLDPDGEETQLVVRPVTSQEIKKPISSIENRVSEHRAKIADPERFIPNFKELDPRQQQALLGREGEESLGIDLLST